MNLIDNDGKTVKIGLPQLLSQTGAIFERFYRETLPLMLAKAHADGRKSGMLEAADICLTVELDTTPIELAEEIKQVANEED